MNSMATTTLSLNISAVEREIGLSKDVLRMWERRYGFPKPQRDENGERQYTVAEIAKLHAIKRLMDLGLRPGKVIHAGLDELNALVDARAPARDAAIPPDFERDIVTMLKTHDAPGLQNALANLVMRQGLQKFVLESVTPLNRAVGESWMRGELQVFEEHLYTEQLQVALRTAINAFPRQTGTPRVLLTTFPGEQHGLGLLMVEALLGAGRRAVHLAGRADPAGGHPPRGAGAQGAPRRPVLFRRVSGAPGHRRPRHAAPGVAAVGDAVGRGRDDATGAQDDARRRPHSRPRGVDRGAQELAHALGAGVGLARGARRALTLPSRRAPGPALPPTGAAGRLER